MIQHRDLRSAEMSEWLLTHSPSDVRSLLQTQSIGWSPGEPVDEDWFLRQQRMAVEAPVDDCLYRDPNPDRTHVDLVRWRAVGQAKATGLTWRDAFAEASGVLAARGRPFAGTARTMKYSYDKIQRFRKAVRVQDNEKLFALS
jgi:hypothetical protein